MGLERQQATRGFGFLENYLALQRAKRVNRLIPASKRQGRILDFGCGSYPYFLLTSDFKEKFGLDKSQGDYIENGIKVKKFDFGQIQVLPYPDNYFDAVTALAVAEHLSEKLARQLWLESYRVLAKGGVLIITTPARKTRKLLEVMAGLRLVSSEEIAEHQQFYNIIMLKDQLADAGFRREAIQASMFEMGLNLSAVAKK